MRIKLAELHLQLKATMIYVTHDQIEAMTMADRIVVLRAGVIEQVGTPLDLYNNPANTFVAGFIGSPKMNLIEARVTESGPAGVNLFISGGSSLTVSPRAGLEPGRVLTVGLRPEMIGLTSSGTMSGVVDVVEHLGGETLCYVNVGAGPLITAKLEASSRVAVGDAVQMGLIAGHPLLFDEGGQSLGPGGAA